MAVRSKTDGLVHLLKRESMAKGVKVYYNEDGTVSIELHIIVENGVNLVAVCRSIMSEVRYVVSKTTGVEAVSYTHLPEFGSGTGSPARGEPSGRPPPG